MKQKTKFFALIIFLIIFGCAEKQKEVFNDTYFLNGELEEIENGTWIYLLLNDKVIDSAQVLQNKFSMTGKLEQPKKFNLYIKNTNNYTRIWLEPKKIGFRAKNGEFNKATITGSKSQIESENLWEPIWKYRKKRDSLITIISNDKIDDNLKKTAIIELKKVNKNHLKIEKDFINNNPNSYVSAANLDFYTTSFSKEIVSKLYNNFSEQIKNSTYGLSIHKFLELNRDINIGDTYVDFSMTNENKEFIKLSDFEGKLILLDFWASYCGPCIAEYPALKEAYWKFKDNGFEIISVSEDQTREDWIKAIEKNGLNWVNLWEENGNKADPFLIYGINGIPDNFLINKNGIIIARNLRGEKLIATIKKNL